MVTIRNILNRLLKAKSNYWVQGNKIYRNLPWGFAYCCDECKSPEEANRVAFQLNSVK